MTDNQDKINELLEKLAVLKKRQDDFSLEMNFLKCEINKLKAADLLQNEKKNEIIEDKEVTNLDIESEIISDDFQPTFKQTKEQSTNTSEPINNTSTKTNIDLEKFIGENIINKIGIAVTIIGVAIGTKYSIEHELISPLTRIILGYLTGIGLLGFGIKLKRKYESYSAVLVSGAIAIMYFITYSAYSFYGLFPQVLAFSLMVIFTAFTVVAAINYNKQVIAHIGLVGAYAIPFLLSNGSGKVAILFSYMAIINIGVLIISFKKYWKPLYYSSFGLTWLMYFGWYASKYTANQHFSLALVFLLIFFGIFYSTFLAYKLLKNDKFNFDDIILLLANSFVFYGIGYAILNNHESGKHYLGLFTLLNALVHFVFSSIIYRKKLADRNLFYLVSGLVLVFITIAIPVQLDGNWVTLLWAGEATLLFWIGRTKKINIYEQLSYPLIFLAFFSIAQDWTSVYGQYNPGNLKSRITPLLNINFLTSLLFIASFGFINYVHNNKQFTVSDTTKNDLIKFVFFSIPTILLMTIFYSFYLEIENYWNQLFKDSMLNISPTNEPNSVFCSNYDLLRFKTMWLINYTLWFVSVLSLVNKKKIKNQRFGKINFGLSTMAIVVFLVLGLYTLSDLRESYLAQTLSEYYKIGVFNLGIRYVSIVFFVLAIVPCFNYVKEDLTKIELNIAFDLLLYISVLWVLSSELLHWLSLAKYSQSYKLGLSILWGLYSLFLIALGIWKQKKHLRITAIALFGVTLIKLFFYDISQLDTIAKTVLLVSLGVLLLIISFLYNKYKHVITDENNV